MSIRERTAWIAVSCTVIIWGYYFVAFASDVFTIRLNGNDVLIRFIACMVVSFVVMIGLAVLMNHIGKRSSFDAKPDEMERQIEGYADRIGFRFLEAIIPIALIGGLLLAGRISEAFPADPGGSTALIFANGILFVIVLTELVRESVHIIGFRMSA